MRLTISALLVLTVWASGVLAGAGLNPPVPNPGFEQGLGAWGWSVINGAKTWCKVVSDNPHSGRKCLVVVNENGLAGNVYGRLSAVVEVKPDTEYELSAWVRGTDVNGEGAGPNFTDWLNYQVGTPSGTFGWTRVATRLRTKPNQYSQTVGLNSVNFCKELAVDDIELRPVGIAFRGEGVEAALIAPSRLVGDASPGYLGVRINSSTKPVAALEASVKGSQTTMFVKRAKLKASETELLWDWDSGKAPFGDYDCLVKLLDSKGNVLAEGSQKIAKVDSPLSKGMDAVQARMKQFDALYKQCKAKKIPLDYPTTAKTTVEQFLPLFRKDIQTGHDWRVEFGIKDLNRSLDEAEALMKACLADPSVAPDAVRYQTGPVAIEGLSFVGKRKDSYGANSRGPLFFCGYGHFGQLRADMPRWPGYGVNLIQFAELGPCVTFPEDGVTDLKSSALLEKTLDEAAKQNVRVDYLISPHCFPQWATQKWPHLASGGGGFLGFCPDLSEAKKIMEDYLRIVLPKIKDKPALHSICLTNEPVLNNTASAPNTKPMWAAYLAKIHGDLTTMNERYGSSYAAFADVPVPANDAYDAPQFYDWCVFNQERFAGWHKWMADICHELAPNIPVHAKMMSMALPHRFTISWGVDPEMFGKLSDINGNDCLSNSPPSGGWAAHVGTQNMSYDLQRSLSLKPIFNSENHPTGDRSTYYVAPEHFKTVLWQGAVHGQGSTTLWVWEHSYDPGSDLYGNAMDRPGCAQALGTTCLDLNRFSKEMTALQNAKAPVAILFSIASITRSQNYLEVLSRVYNALSYNGTKIDFISEKQLALGNWSKYRMVIVPNASHVLPATFREFKDMPASTRLVIVGDGLVKDPYGKDYPADDLKGIRDRSLCVADADPEKVLWPALRDELGRLGGLPELSVVDAATGEPVWGVEWLPAKIGDRTIVNLVQLRDKPVDVKIMRQGRPVAAQDLLTLGGRESVETLRPITPILAELR